MSKINLVQSPVKFYENGVHTEKGWFRYFLNDTPLLGITSIISKMLFPDKYSNVNPDVLRASAERGSLIHSMCELYDGLGIEPEDEQATPYPKLLKENGLKVEASEYVVSDEKNFASPIDKVFRVSDDTFDIGDIKTVSRWDEEEKRYVSWQLSIYAYFFEMQNPGAHVRKLYGIWLPKKRYGNARIEEVGRIPIADVMNLLDCYLSGLPFVQDNELVEKEGMLPRRYAAMETAARELQSKVALYTEQFNLLKSELLKAMQENNVYSWKSETLTLTRKASYERITLDTAKLLEDHPEIDRKFYEKVSRVGESLNIKFK